MASRGSIATRRALALARLREGFERLAEQSGVKAPELVIQKNATDPDLEQARLIESLAEWVDSYSPPPAPEDEEPTEDAPQDDDSEQESVVTKHQSAYSGMTKRELKAIANERGISISGFKTNLEIVDLLEAVDGKTEDEQAAEDEA